MHNTSIGGLKAGSRAASTKGMKGVTVTGAGREVTGHVQLGDLLVRNGVLTASQRDEVLEAQRVRGGPFGRLAEEMFEVHPSAVEKAWAEQYANFAQRVDPKSYTITQETLQIVSRRQAWQFRFLPLAIVDNGLLACTTQDSVARALRFAGWRLGHSCQMVLADPIELGRALCEHYPLAGMRPDSVLEELPSLAR